MHPASLKTTVHAFTHTGQRSENQDRLAVLSSPDDDSHLCLVADGLGGHVGGALAAQTVADTAEKAWNRRPASLDSRAFLDRLVQDAHTNVCRVGSNHELTPRSTLAALLLQGGQALSIHAGDTRVMQFSRSHLINFTRDHSHARLLVTQGLLSEEQLTTHPDQARLYSCVGGPRSPVAEVTRWDLSNGTQFVVCSDGFWEIFLPAEILYLFASDDPLAELKRRFRRKLRRLKDHDNTSAILINAPALTG